MTTATMPKGFFAIRLRELRTSAELTQAQLAEKSELSEGAIKQFEQGRREPTFETLAKLAAGLGVSLAAFDQEPVEPVEEKPARKRRPKKDG